MKIYLVGGAVRDRYLASELGLERAGNDRDWVVVGADLDELPAAGYQRVGKSFPVFLHPQSKEEYALARSADGGFSPDVTLEEDLARRDLSINAMAESAAGELIDPWGGLEDLRRRRLRHVGAHFADDPLRILRVARFAAQLDGFVVASQTNDLMADLVQAGHLAELPAERVFGEFDKALAAPKPQRFIEVLRDCGALAVLLPEVEALFGVPQPERFHPEIDTGRHLLLALAMSAELAPGDARVGFAVLLHDLGKGLTPKEKLPSHHGHEAAGLPLVKAVCRRLGPPNRYRELALAVCEFHLHCHKLAELRAGTILKMLNRIGAFRHPERLREFGLACEADARGRTGLHDQPYPQAGWLIAAFEAAASVSARGLIDQGVTPGIQLGERLAEARIRQIKSVMGALA